jgi:hypothetical protein
MSMPVVGQVGGDMATANTNAPFWVLRNNIRREIAFVRGRYGCPLANLALHRAQRDWLHAEPNAAEKSAQASALSRPIA